MNGFTRQSIFRVTHSCSATISLLLPSRPSQTTTRRRALDTPTLALQLYSCAVWNPSIGAYEISPGCTVNAGQPTQLNVISNCIAYGCTNVASCDEAWPIPKCTCVSAFTGSTCSTPNTTGSAAGQSQDSGGSGLPLPIIAGAAAGGALVVVLAVVLVCRHQRKAQRVALATHPAANAHPSSQTAHGSDGWPLHYDTSMFTAHNGLFNAGGRQPLAHHYESVSVSPYESVYVDQSVQQQSVSEWDGVNYAHTPATATMRRDGTGTAPAGRVSGGSGWNHGADYGHGGGLERAQGDGGSGTARGDLYGGRGGSAGMVLAGQNVAGAGVTDTDKGDTVYYSIAGLSAPASGQGQKGTRGSYEPPVYALATSSSS